MSDLNILKVALIRIVEVIAAKAIYSQVIILGSRKFIKPIAVRVPLKPKRPSWIWDLSARKICAVNMLKNVPSKAANPNRVEL